MSPLRRAMFRVRGAYHLAAAVLSGAGLAAAAGPEPQIREDDAAQPRRERVMGVVEQFRRERASGWITVERGHAPVTISLHVGKVRALTATALARADAPRRHGAGEIRHFELPLLELWQFVGPSTRLSIRADGRALPIAGCGMFRRGAGEAVAEPKNLAAALHAGGSFDEDGQFRPA